MLGRTRSFSLVGLDAIPVEVEARATETGQTTFCVVGLPDKAVNEARERVRSGIAGSYVRWPEGRVTVNLAPAFVRKEGSGFDLAIAVAVLAAAGEVPRDGLDRLGLLGELALDGALRPVRGGLAAAQACRALGMEHLLCPPATAAEAALCDGVAVLPVRRLRDVVDWLRGERDLARADPPPVEAAPPACDDLSDVRGQPVARRALEVAASGGHNLLLVGPPGVGKTMLARRLPGILPPLDDEEALEVLRVRSAAGLPVVGQRPARPFRAPHHSATAVALVGGGPRLAPGEITLAANGVLFLDELPEFRRDALEALRAPLEDGEVTIARAAGRVAYPARAALVAAMNPCPCGAPDDAGCTCDPARAAAYRRRVSGPLLDRIDLGVRLARPDAGALRQPAPEGSEEVRARVEGARGRQLARQGVPNARLAGRALREHGALDDDADGILATATDRLRLSPRAVDRVLRVSRTVADLAGADRVGREHVAEALSLRIGTLA